jgi:hypothetical protein
LQQLQIVNDYKANIMAALEAAGAGAQRGDGEAGRVIDEQRQRFQFGRGAREIAEILLADLAHAQQFATNPRLLRQDTRGKLIGGHFEAEKGDLCADRFFGRNTVFLIAQPAARSVEGQIGGKCGLAHARTSGQDEKI